MHLAKHNSSAKDNFSAKHILCLYLPRWAITRYCRRRPEHQGRAIAVIHSTGQRRQVVTCSDRAGSFGIRSGLSAAEARALCNHLITVEQDVSADRRTLRALGRWMMRFTPIVASGWNDVAETDAATLGVAKNSAIKNGPTKIGAINKNRAARMTAAEADPAALFLDLTGCERLFGGVEPIIRQVRQSLARFRIPAQLAVAPTPGAAWAFAFAGAKNFSGAKTFLGAETHAGQNVGGKDDPQIEAADLPGAMSALPVNALRLEESVVFDLRRLGLNRVGDLLAIPRDQLPARFGPSLLMRLDQLTGDRAEPLTKLVCDPPIGARADFESPVEALEAVQLVFEKLLGLVLLDLTRRNHGVRQLRLICTPERGWGREIVQRTICLTRPHRHRAALLELLRGEIERIDLEHGFIRLQLRVPLHEPVSDTQTQLFDHQLVEEQLEFERLYQRLRVRLDEAAVIQPGLVESHVPERAWRPAAKDCPLATASPSDTNDDSSDARSSLPRPLTLFAMPVEIRVICEPSDDRTGRPCQFSWHSQVYRLAHVAGPERIAGEWWRGHNHTRDYYDVEDAARRRFWIFRVLHKRPDESLFARWFLQGRFE